MPRPTRRLPWPLLTAATIAMASTSSSAQDGFQVVLDTLTEMDRATILTDGSIAIAMLGPEKNVIWVADNDGVPQSCFSVPASLVPQAFEIAADLDGGLYITTITAVQIWDNEPFDADTVSVTVRTMSVSTSGEVGFSKDITLTSYLAGTVWGMTERFHLAVDPSGLFISLSDGVAMSGQHWYLKLSPTGEVAWCKLQYDGTVSSVVPEFDIAPSGDGGMYFVMTNIGGATNGIDMGRLNAEGELVWVNHFGYQNNVITVEMNDIITASTGRPIAAGSLIGFGYGYGYLLSPTADGTGVSGHFYDIPAETDKAFRSIHELPNGELFATTRGIWDTEQHLGLLHLGTDMEVINALRTQVVPSGQNDNWHRPQIVSELDGKLVLPGSLRSEDQVFGYIQYHPSIWKIDLDATNACMVSETAIPHYVIPDSLLVIEPITNYTLTPYMAEVEDGPMSTTPETPISVSDLCVQLVSVPEAAYPTGTLEAYPNPAEAGSILNIQCQRAVRFTLFSTTGEEVLNIPAFPGSDKTAFSASGLAPGLYAAVAFSEAGQRLATTKVEVR